MLEAYVDTYQAYRAGTKRITTWLVCAAQRCGTDTVFLDSPVADTNGDVEQTNKIPSAQQGIKAVPLNQLVGLAQAVASSTEPKISLPEEIAVLIRTIVALRKQANDFFCELKTSNQVADERQQHFISILEEVLIILQPRTNSDGAEPLAGLLDALSVEGCSLQDENHEPTPSEEVHKPVEVVEYDIEASETNGAFAIFALLKEFNDIRESLRTVWTDYLNGKLDVMSAAVTTDTALHLLKHSWSEIVQADKGIEDFSTMAGILKYHGNGAGTFSTDLHDWVCGDVALLLQEYERTLRVTRTPVAIPGALGEYDPKQDRSKLTTEEKYKEDRIVFLELLPEFTCLSRVREDFPVRDLLTDGLKQMMYANQFDALPAYALFGSQILLDIHHVLRAKAIRPFQELRATARRIIHSVDDYFRHSQGMTCDTWTPEHDEMLRQLRTFAKSWAFTDQIGNIPRGAMRGMRPKPYHLLKNHPVLSGLLTFRLNMMMNDVGIQLCNAWGSVVCPAHLYNAARQRCNLEQTWDDIEYVLGVHSEQRIFMGPRPTEEADFGKRLTLALGTFAVDFVKDSQQREDSCISLPEKDAPGLKETSPVKVIFRSRYMDDGLLDLSTSNVVTMMDYAAKAGRLRPSAMDVTEFSQKMFERKQYTSLQLLQAVREGVASEELHLLFDYFGLHHRSWRLLKAIDAKIKDNLVECFGPDYLEDQSRLPSIAVHILNALTGAQREVGGVMLREAASVLAEFLQRDEGGKSIASAKMTVYGP